MHVLNRILAAGRSALPMAIAAIIVLAPFGGSASAAIAARGAPTDDATIAVAPADALTNCLLAVPFTFAIGLPEGSPANVRGYEVVFSIDPAVVTIANPLTDVAEGPFLSSVGTTEFYVLEQGSGVYSVSCAILGGDIGAGGNGELFSVVLTPTAEGMSPIAMVSVKLRDLDNNELPVAAAGSSLRVDCTSPTMEPIVESEDGWYNNAPVLSNFGFDDNVNLDLAQYAYDLQPWTTLFSGIDAPSWDDDGWVLPGWNALSQGAHTIYFRVKDDAGNWNQGSYLWRFYKDTIPYVYFQPLTKEIEPGALCTLQVMVDDAVDSLSCMEVFIAFDTSCAQFVKAIEGNAFKTAGYPTFFRWEAVADDTASAVDCLLGYRSYFLAPGELVKLVFRGLEPGVCEVRFTSARLWDIMRVEIAPEAGDDARIVIRWPTPAGPAAPSRSTLRNYPNPFNPVTTLILDVGAGAARSDATVSIYTTSGQLVRALFSGRLESGERRFVWDGKDNRGEAVAAGIYVAVAETAAETLTRKLVLIR